MYNNLKIKHFKFEFKPHFYQKYITFSKSELRKPLINAESFQCLQSFSHEKKIINRTIKDAFIEQIETTTFIFNVTFQILK